MASAWRWRRLGLRLQSMAGLFALLFVVGNLGILRAVFRGGDYVVLDDTDHGSLFSSDGSSGNRQYENGFYLANDDQWRLARGRRFVLGHRPANAAGEGRLPRRLMANRHRNRESNNVRDTSTQEDTEKVDISVDFADINCQAMANITHREFLSAGWTKAVYGGKYNGRPVAVKTVNMNGHDIEMCMKQQSASVKECYRRSAAKILKEIVLLRELLHENMLKVFGYCIPNREFSGEDVGIVAMVTELGEPLDIIRLLQMSWEDRLRISLGLARLLHHLSSSSLGSLAMNDFRRQQFVLVDGALKLSDVDDIGLDEPSCVTAEDCFLHIAALNSTINFPCKQGRCKGYNERQNVANAGRHFTTFLLPHGAPSTLRPLVDQIVEGYSDVSWSARDILDATERLAHLYISGQYLNRPSTLRTYEYIKKEESDLPGIFDYRCQLSLSGNGCTMSVFDVHEAEDICSRDPDCKAFVMTLHTTWTGRKLVHFKNNYTTAEWNADTTLYLKVS